MNRSGHKNDETNSAINSSRSIVSLTSRTKLVDFCKT